ADSTVTLATGSPGEPIEGPGFALLLRRPLVLDQPATFRVLGPQVAVERLQNSIQVEPGSSPSLCRIVYRHADPELAAAVVNAMASVYRELRATAGREAASRRRAAIATQLVGLADSLAKAQDEVVAYQQRAGLLEPTSEGGRVMGAV